MPTPEYQKNPETIRIGWLIDGSGSSIKENVRLRIRNGTIASVEPAKQKSDASEGGLDLSGHTILPCLVDSHVHLFMSGTADPGFRSHQLDACFSEIKKSIADHVVASLRCGIVAVRDGGDRRAHALRYKKECLDAGSTPFLLRAAGSAWHRPGRYGKLIGRAPPAEMNLAEAISADETGCDHVKIVQSGLNSLIKFSHQTAPQFNLEEMTAAVGAAKRRGLSVMVHANGTVPVSIAVASGCHSIEHGFFMGRENLTKMAERHIYWVPTAATMQAYADHLGRSGENPDVARRNLDHQIEQIAAAKSLGVPIAAGTDAGSLGVHHGTAVVAELKILLAAGFSIQQAIMCASLNGSRLLGLKNLFLLAKGMPATFIVVKESPSGLPESLHQIEKLCINGRLYDPGREF